MNAALHFSVTCAEDVPRIRPGMEQRDARGTADATTRRAGDRRLRRVAARRDAGRLRHAGRERQAGAAAVRRHGSGDAARVRHRGREGLPEQPARDRAGLRPHRVRARLRTAPRSARSSTPAASRSCPRRASRSSRRACGRPCGRTVSGRSHDPRRGPGQVVRQEARRAGGARRVVRRAGRADHRTARARTARARRRCCACSRR